MKIREVRDMYSTQLDTYREQKQLLAEQRKQLTERMKQVEQGSVLYAEEAATLELTYNAVSEKYNEYQKFMNQLTELEMLYMNQESTKQQTEAAKEYGEDLAKVLTVARRIAHGDKVPAKDEQKLIEYSSELYMSAKNAAMLKANKDKKEYDSLWEDEEEKEKPEDPMDVAENKEIGGAIAMPEVVDVEDVMASASDM